jgi:hypothetical protein
MKLKQTKLSFPRNSCIKNISYFLGLFCLFLAPLTLLNADSIEIRSDDLLFGTWINEEYETPGEHGAIYVAKCEIFADGVQLGYWKILDKIPMTETHLVFKEAWIDDQGIHWYKMRGKSWMYPSGAGKTEGFYIFRIDPIRLSLESVFAQYDYPSEVSPGGSWYRIRYKAK